MKLIKLLGALALAMAPFVSDASTTCPFDTAGGTTIGQNLGGGGSLPEPSATTSQPGAAGAGIIQ